MEKEAAVEFYEIDQKMREEAERKILKKAEESKQRERGSERYRERERKR